MNDAAWLELLTPIILQPTPAERIKRGPKPQGDVAMSRREIKKRSQSKRAAARLQNIAILDMETDPFDKSRPLDKIKPFAACLYCDDFEPVIIWEENEDDFVSAVLQAIENLPHEYTIFAHNGGKFDYLFLLHRLRGFVSFKGRGIMSAKIGRHTLRDSYHIIPERLAAIQKDAFNYEKMRKSVRHKYRNEILRYLVNDCVYLLDVVKKFIAEFGLKLSIGQAAKAELQKHYKVETLGDRQDAFLRNYFFGGRCECVGGRGVFGSNVIEKRPFHLYDVNSMYPHVMAAYSHPMGNQFTVRGGAPGVQTCFIELECRNFGALVKRGDDGEISADFDHGIFRTTIWEYQTALKHGLIEAVKINWCIDFAARSDFSKFVLPRYEKRFAVKARLKTLQEGTPEWFETRKDDTFLKLILNNAYGKFAQNPRDFKDYYLTSENEIPDINDCSGAVKTLAALQPELADQAVLKEWGYRPSSECEGFWIWSRPQAFRQFYNVATAASITGASRAVLLDALATADDPVYCDTDSIICRGLPGTDLHNERLGAWKIEAELDEVIVAGKKLYGYKIAGVPDGQPGRVKVRSKGVQDVTWHDLERMLDDELLTFVNPAPTFTKMGTQSYMTRNVRATVGRNTARIVRRKAA